MLWLVCLVIFIWVGCLLMLGGCAEGKDASRESRAGQSDARPIIDRVNRLPPYLPPVTPEHASAEKAAFREAGASAQGAR